MNKSIKKLLVSIFIVILFVSVYPAFIPATKTAKAESVLTEKDGFD